MFLYYPLLRLCRGREYLKCQMTPPPPRGRDLSLSVYLFFVSSLVLRWSHPWTDLESWFLLKDLLHCD